MTAPVNDRERALFKELAKRALTLELSNTGTTTGYWICTVCGRGGKGDGGESQESIPHEADCALAQHALACAQVSSSHRRGTYMEANCLICGAKVPEAEQADHLQLAHPCPAGGYKFFFEGRAFFTLKPSMTVPDLLKAINYEWQEPRSFVEERDGKDIYYTFAHAVDLTREPRFMIVLPAYGGGAPR